MIYDVEGRAIAELTPHGRQAIWDLRDAKGRRVPAGTYFAISVGAQRRSVGPIQVLQP
jgi:hypothetical protein